MTDLSGSTVRLRTVNPSDIDTICTWENDPAVWTVSGTTEPFSRSQIEQFVEIQQHDIIETHQLRLMIETRSTGEPIGTLDLFEFDPIAHRAGIGILIYAPEHRGKGYASDALNIVCKYARRSLRMHQLWCTVGTDNTASLALFRRAGFEQTGLLRDWHRTETGYADEIILQKIL